MSDKSEDRFIRIMTELRENIIPALMRIKEAEGSPLQHICNYYEDQTFKDDRSFKAGLVFGAATAVELLHRHSVRYVA